MAVNENSYVHEPSPTQEHVGRAQPLMLHPAIVNLRDYQGQLDEGGVCVAVSRQAVEETLDITMWLLEALEGIRSWDCLYDALPTALAARVRSALRKATDGRSDDRATADAEPGMGRRAINNTTPENPHD